MAGSFMSYEWPERAFRIITSWPKDQFPNQPESIPWRIIEPHREQAYKNHRQTLERLDQRGGLDAMEAVAVLEDRDYRKRWQHTGDRLELNAQIREAINRLQEIVRLRST